jgi:hypothetical protein
MQFECMSTFFKETDMNLSTLFNSPFKGCLNDQKKLFESYETLFYFYS